MLWSRPAVITVSSISRRSLVLWGLFCLVFIVSLILTVTLNGSSRTRVLFFPDHRPGVTGEPHLIGERRNLPVRDDIERNAELLVKELLLGPTTVSLDRLLPRDTRMRTIMYRNNILYIDFSGHLMYTEGLVLTFDEVIETIKHNLRFNYPALERIIITVEGFEPL